MQSGNTFTFQFHFYFSLLLFTFTLTVQAEAVDLACSEWEYDKSELRTESIVAENNWVCQKTALVSCCYFLFVNKHCLGILQTLYRCTKGPFSLIVVLYLQTLSRCAKKLLSSNNFISSAMSDSSSAYSSSGFQRSKIIFQHPTHRPLTHHTHRPTRPDHFSTL